METKDKDKKERMKSYVSRIIIYNRAPFDKLNLSFEENGISVLTGINGQGKTTILSYIVDSWFELIRSYYVSEFKGHEDTYHRLASQMYVLDTSKPSIVYIRHKIGDKFIDYINLEDTISEQEYDEIVDLEGKLSYKSLKEHFEGSGHTKLVSATADEKFVKTWLEDNVVTSFPSFRYELPFHITDYYKHTYKFKKDFNWSGALKNPLLVISGIDAITDWLMDLVLDMKQYDAVDGHYETDLWMNVSDIITSTLSSKFNKVPLRLGLGRRNAGASRISVVRKSDKIDVYPSIFGLSSGELSIFNIFVEIIRQADNLETNIKHDHIQGIVVIDEIDKHLHIKLQKEVLPAMLELFPNVQFIVSTHSPFLTMGLAENAKTLERSKIIDLDQGGMVTEPKSIEIYNNLYNMMIEENDNFKELYDDLQNKLKAAAKPLVITEGKTDAKHIKNAITRLGITDIDVEFYEIGNQKWGDSELKNMLEHLAKLKNQRKIIGIFDRDNDSIVKFATDAINSYINLQPGCNVYAFCIPLVNEAEYGSKISIEHYYHKKDLLKENPDDRRIFLGEEFIENGNSKDAKYQTRISNISNKIKVNGIIDEKVYNRDDIYQKKSIAMTKNDFADLVCGDTDYANGFDFSNFKQITDIIKEICAI